MKVASAQGYGYSSYSEQEVLNFASLVNQHLADDEQLKSHLPIDLNKPDTFFTKLEDGLILCKLLNKAKPNIIDERALNYTKLSVYKKVENLNLAISAAKSLGMVLIGVDPQIIMSGKQNVILGWMWQNLRKIIVEKINLKDSPYLIRLKQEEETLEQFNALTSEQLLLRWLNFHLKEGGVNKEVKNFGKDLQDSIVYQNVLHQLDKSVNITGIESMSEEERAEKTITDSKKQGVDTAIQAKDIISANPRLNLLFCAQIYNNNPGLEPPTEEETKEFAEFLDGQDEGDSREERTFRAWINSLNLQEEQITNLFEGMEDGLLLLRVVEHLKPGVVDWKKVEKVPKHVIKKINNCNYGVQLCKDQLKLSLVGIGGKDIVDKNKKLLLAIVWQLMKDDVLNKIGKLKESDLINWLNAMANTEPKIKALKDKALSNSIIFFNVLQAINKNIINWEYVKKEDDDEAKKNNAQYVVSVARKLGASIFIVWEDIVEVKPKMIMTFVAALKEVAENKGKSIEQQAKDIEQQKEEKAEEKQEEQVEEKQEEKVEEKQEEQVEEKQEEEEQKQEVEQ